ncbi:MAG: HAD family hydrolase [Candidatus Micrarchaeota archaeon]|nr:HAD family hydrolase [Candidatus Micrarchaeota archaeon]
MLVMLFDLGGVLVDTSRAVAEGYRRGFAASGMEFEFTAEQILHLRGIGRYNSHMEAIRALVAISSSGSRIDGILSQANAENILDTLIENELSDSEERKAAAIEAAFRAFNDSIEVSAYMLAFPGAREGLERFRSAGVRLGVVSNADRRRVTVLLNALGNPSFDVVLSSDDVESKPSGDGILRAMRTLSADSRRTYYVGDSVKDVQAARQAGCKSVIILTGHGTRDQISREGPDLVFESFAEMAAYFLKT